MSDLSALAYLEMRRATNFARGTAHHPARILLWIAAFLWLGFVTVGRILARHRADVTQLHDPLASILGFSALLWFGAMIVMGTNGRLGTFSHGADARFLTMSQLRPRTVVLWLHVRNSLLGMTRLGIAMIFYTAFFARTHPLSAFLAMFGVSFIAMLLPLPAFEAARRFGITPVRALGYVLVVIGLTAAASALFVPSVLTAGFGHAVISVWYGDARALAMLYALVVALMFSSTLGADDLYPELYAASMKWFGQVRTHVAAALYRPKRGSERVTSLDRAPNGIMIVLWKEALALARSPGLRTVFSIECAIALVGGATAGIYGRHSPEVLTTIAATITFLLIVLLANSGTSLTHDISKPLWWMGTGSTMLKLAAWSWATSLDTTVVFLLGATALSVASGYPQFILAGIFVAFVFPTLIRVIGVVTYAFFPAAIDQRGPVAALRMFIIYLCLAPATVTLIVVSFATHAVLLGGIAGFIVLFGEAALCLLLAARRIEGRGAEYAVAERT